MRLVVPGDRLGVAAPHGAQVVGELGAVREVLPGAELEARQGVAVVAVEAAVAEIAQDALFKSLK